MTRAILALLVMASTAGADLSAVLAERNLEKRSRKALDYAAQALKAARNAYQQGQFDQTRQHLQELNEAVQLAYRSLQETGKNPVRHPKHFKHAEIKTRELLKHLGHFRDQMAYDDRAVVEPVIQSIETIHEDLLLAIMGKKSK
jgi:uncharacterized membrane protein YccC